MSSTILNIKYRQPLVIAFTCVICWVFTFISIKVYANYAVGLFIWLPIVMGAVSTILFGYRNETTKRVCRETSFYTLIIFCIGLLFFAFEGIICIIMAAPIGLFFSWLGHLIGYEIVKSKAINQSLITALLIIFVPAISGFESVADDKPVDLRSVTTTIIINSPPEKVWQNVIAFPQLNTPTELLFKAGIAYPINAQITGTGVGAVRHCNFSTGSFVEPVTRWQAPTLLQFDVAEQPETMKELNLYNLHPNHLHGYFISKRGQFKLTRLTNGNTLLEGTTWYYNKIKPNIYWDLWSDHIIHKIHERVLSHIKLVTENGKG